MLEFDKLIKTFEKSKHQIAKKGPPAYYITTLVELEDYISDATEDKNITKKLNSLNARAFNAMKQKIRKYNKDFERSIAAYRAVRMGFFSCCEVYGF